MVSGTVNLRHGTWGGATGYGLRSAGYELRRFVGGYAGLHNASSAAYGDPVIYWLWPRSLTRVQRRWFMKRFTFDALVPVQLTSLFIMLQLIFSRIISQILNNMSYSLINPRCESFQSIMVTRNSLEILNFIIFLAFQSCFYAWSWKLRNVWEK